MASGAGSTAALEGVALAGGDELHRLFATASGGADMARLLAAVAAAGESAWFVCNDSLDHGALQSRVGRPEENIKYDLTFSQ